MRSFNWTSLVAVGATLALWTGCSGGNIAGPAVEAATQSVAIGTETSSGPPALPTLLMRGMPAPGAPTVHPFIDFGAMAKNKGPTIAVSDGPQEAVDLFSAYGTQVGQLTGFNNPRGMASDAKGDLYVVDQENSRVQIYAAGFASPPTTLSDAGQFPLDVDSFANGAYVAVTNEVATPLGPGSVSIFKGSTLQRTVSDSNLEYALYCAFDGKGNLYVDGVSTNNTRFLAEIAHATSGGSTFEQLTTTNTLSGADGIQVSRAGQIVIVDSASLAIYTYNPPVGGSLGTPTQITPLGKSLAPYTFAFTRSMTDFYAADEASSSILKYAILPAVQRRFLRSSSAAHRSALR